MKATHVDIIHGTAAFEDPHHVAVTSAATAAGEAERIRGENFLIACGTKPAHSPIVPCDGIKVLDADHILSETLPKVPRELIVVGAGVVGIEYASMINVLPGTSVTVIDARPEILTFADREVVSSLQHEMSIRGARFLFDEQVKSTTVSDKHVTVELASGKRVRGDALLYTIGRQANTAQLNLQALGIEHNERGLLTVNREYQTNIPHM